MINNCFKVRHHGEQKTMEYIFFKQMKIKMINQEFPISRIKMKVKIRHSEINNHERFFFPIVYLWERFPLSKRILNHKMKEA
jgi:hypothetical protein